MELSIMRLPIVLLFSAMSVFPAFKTEMLSDDVRIDRTYGSQEAQVCRIICDSAGGYSVFWLEKSMNGDSYLKGRCFDLSGTPRAEERNLFNFNTVSGMSFGSVEGSGYGTYALILSQELGGAYQYLFQRFDFDLTSFDPAPVPICTVLAPLGMSAAIDRDYQLVTALTAEGAHVLDYDTMKVFYHNRAGLAGRIVHPCDYTSASGIIYPVAAVVHRQKKVTLFFQHYKWVGTGLVDWSGISSRTVSFEDNQLAWVSGFQTIYETQGTAAPAFYGAYGREDYYSAWCGYGENGQCAVAEVKDDGSLDGDKLMNGFQVGWSFIGGGFQGKHALVSGTTGDSIWLTTYSPEIPSMPAFVGLGNNARAGMDFNGNTSVFRERDKSVFFSRRGSDTLSNIRINSMDSDPVIASCVTLSGAGGGFAAFKDRNSDSVTLAAYPDSGIWTAAVPANGGYGYPRLAGDASRVVMAMTRPGSSTDTAVVMHVWNRLTGSLSASRNVSDNGAMAVLPDVAISGNRVAVVWEDRRPARGDTSYVFLQLFDTLGNAVGGNIPVSPGTSPRVTAAESGRFLITFNYSTTTVTIVGGIPVVRFRSNVFACLFNSQGAVEVPVFRVNVQPDAAASPSSCAVSGNGNNLVLWLESGKLFGRLVGPGGSFVGGVKRFADLDSAVSSFAASRVNDSVSAVAWHDRNSGEVRYAFFTGDNTPLGVSVTASNRRVDSDLPVSIGVSGCDSTVVVMWLDGQYYSRTKHRLLADFIRLPGGASTALEKRVPGPLSGRQVELELSPNPFNPRVAIRIRSSVKAGPVTLRIFDIRGNLIKDLSAAVLNGNLSGRSGEIWWNGTDRADRRVAAGIYLIELGHRGSRISRPVHLMR